jgi:hypothetical protein
MQEQGRENRKRRHRQKTGELDVIYPGGFIVGNIRALYMVGFLQGKLNVYFEIIARIMSPAFSAWSAMDPMVSASLTI